MAKTLQQILGYRSLTRLVNDAAGGVPVNIIDPGFMSQTLDVSGNTAEFTIMSNARGTVKLVPYGSPSTREAHRTIGSRAIVMLHNYNHQIYSASKLVALRNFDNPDKQQKGIQYVDRQVSEFARKMMNTRMTAIYSMLTLGKIYADVDGNILPSSSSAVLTVDFAVPANNQNQLNGIIAASWATASTDIAAQIFALQKAALQASGLPLTTAYYGDNILGYLVGNTTLAKYLSGNPAFQQAFAANRIPDGFLGMRWIYAGGAFYEDSGGTNRAWWGADTVIFTPDLNRDWYEMNVGSYLVPNGIGEVSAEATDALGQLDEVYGMFSYATIHDDPPGIKHFKGDTFLPVLYIPSAIYQADVTP